MQLGDSRQELRKLSADSFHACVTDPPYNLGTLNDAGWDSQVAFDSKMWREVLRVLKPGGWILSFGGPRTYHRMVTAIEDAGGEVHDQIAWVYSSGFPRGKDPLPAIAAAGGDPKSWEGYGTTLKPSMEPIVLARKPRDGTVAYNAIQHGTGLLNIGASRVGNEERFNPAARNKAGSAGPYMAGKYGMPEAEGHTVIGRHPANLIIDDVVAEMDPELARYFYVAKATRQERLDADGHPTLKPLALMEYLVQMVAPPNARILDPFVGSGTTGVACMQQGHTFHGIEEDPDFATTALARMQGTCWDCSGTGDWLVDPGNGFDTPPHVEPCWCPAGVAAYEKWQASRGAP